MNSSHQLRIDTPEQVSLELPIAGVGSRLLAMALDTLLQVVVFIVVIVGAMLAAGVVRALIPASLAAYLPAIAIVLLFSVYWGYFAAFEILWKGRTPGKRALGLRVIRDSGRPLDVSAALVRNLLRAVDMLPFLYGLGVICMVISRQSKRIGDLVAGTVVVRDDAAAHFEAPWMEAPSSAGGTRPGTVLPDAELTLIEAFLVRRDDLEWQARDRHADQLVARLKARAGLVPEPGQSREEFLEAVARGARSAARFR